MRRPVVLAAAAPVLALGTGSVLAVTVTVYTSKDQWSAAVGGLFLTEDFADDVLNDGVSFTSTESGHINPAQQCYQDVLTSSSQNEPMTVWSFTAPIMAYGGNWTLGGPGGSGNSLLVGLYISDGWNAAGLIPNSYNGGFWGLVCNTPFSAVRLVGGRGTHQQHYSLDDMVYSTVPEPAALGLWALGGLMLIRRRPV